MSMTAEQVMEFAAASASMAIDQRDAYADAIASFRENLIDTLRDERVNDEYLVRDALDAYDAAVARLTA